MSDQTIDSSKELKKQKNKQRFERCVFWAARISFCIAAIALLVFILYVGDLSFLPVGYFVALLVGAVLVVSLQVLFLCLPKHRMGLRIISFLLSVIVLIASTLGTYGLHFIYKNLDQINQGANVTTIVVSIYVKQDSEYENVEQLKNAIVGVRMEEMNDTIVQAVVKLKDELDAQVNIQEYADYNQLIQALKNGDVDAILLDEGMMLNITEFFDATFLQWARLLSEGTRIEQDIDTEQVKVTNAPFIVYISGMDTKGNYPIAENGRSDVNQIVVVNPVTKKILLVNTPRDTYVALDGDPTKMDKLTHAGVYGVNCSIDTLEALYDIKINYYVKVNFRSLVNIIDALGGITVQSDYAFSISKYAFNKGSNNLTGEQALIFVRYRRGLPGGDMQRGVHQQRVIQAVLKKLMSPAVVSNFADVLTAITDNTKTNLPSDSMNALIQMQLKDMATWDIQTYAMFGSGSQGTLYAFGTQVQYPVLSAPEKQVAEIQALIEQVMQTKK